MAITILGEKVGEFSTWLASNADRKDAVGKFAKWIKIDKCWPKDEDDYVLLRAHIRAMHHNSTYTARVAAFEIAWEEYQAEEAKKQLALLKP